MKWQPSSPNIVIGRKERHEEVLLLVAFLHATLVGN